MLKTYVAQAGDTLSKLAARAYGQSAMSPKIAYANPKIIDPNNLVPGSLIVIPQLPIKLPDNFISIFNKKKAVTIRIEDFELTNFEDFEFKSSMDDVADSFAFSTPFDPTNKQQRELFKPFQFREIFIFMYGELVLTGTIINTTPATTAGQQKVTIEGYSKTGVLNDCTYPPGAYPLEFNNLKFVDIVKRTAAYFNLEVIDEVADKYVYNDLDLSPGSKVYSFLSDLAKKRAVLLNSDEEGNIVISRASTEKSAFSLAEGNASIIGISPAYAGQDAYTTITGLQSDSPDDDDDIFGLSDDDDDKKTFAASYTVEDKFLQELGIARPFVFQVDNITKGSLKDVVESKMRRGWGERISYTAEIQGWHDPKNKLWKANTRVNLLYPSAMIYKATELLIKNVTFKLVANQETVTLELVLPQTYAEDEELETLPWLE